MPALTGASHETCLIVGAFALIDFTSIGGLLTYFCRRTAAMASQSLTQKIRDPLYTHLEHLSTRFHDNAKTGDLIQCCSSDVETLRTFLAGQIVEMGRTLIMIIVVTPILF
ncbi:MAG: ABC transporter transmembrane domain-containing protein [Pseudomonadales bacterium]|nr:ABC transporter transmembrane domain-containing protein [Pseudomonadales bacterium]